MAHILIDHEVRDFDEWKPHFDDHDAVRTEHGQQSYQLFQSGDDPNHVVVLFEFDTEEHARKLVGSNDLKARMQDAGVVGEPEITFLERVDSRSMVEPAA